MVDALKEAHRVLRPDGILADLRPDRDPADRPVKQLRVEVLLGRRRMPVGAMYETPEYYPDYLASDRAVRTVLRRGLFQLERSETFWLRTHFKDLSVLERYLAEEWTGTTLPSQTRRSLKILTDRRSDAWIIAADPFRLNILRKVPTHQ